MKTAIRVIAFVSVSALFATERSAQAQDGAALYERHCASCHEASAQTHAPARDALRQFTPERIVDALENMGGPMSTVGRARTPEERRALALYLSEKPFGTDQPINLERAGCKDSKNFTDPLSGANWNGWSPSASNSRFQSAASAGLSANQVPQLKLKWAFAFPGDILAYSQPTVAGGRLFVGSQGGRVFSLDAATGCIHWIFNAYSSVRSATTIGPVDNSGNYAVYFGDFSGNVYGVDAVTGKQLWKTRVETHPAARITGAPKLYAGRLYVPVASLEEGSGAAPTYECCTFRGSIVALDAATGKQIWKTFTLSEEPRKLGKNNKGVQLWGPSGVGVWSSPTLDVSHKRLYVTTGDNYSEPASKTSDAIMALDMDSGKMLWVHQLLEKDAWNVACMRPDNANCPKDAGPDYDFGSAAILVDLPNGRRALVAGQKSGMVYALDPDREGETLWQIRAGKGGLVGGIEWGPAADDRNMYVAVSDLQFDAKGQVAPAGGGGLLALQLSDGKQIWRADSLACPPERKGCSPANSAAVTVISGVVFSGSVDGHLRAYSAADGRVIWDYDTAHEFNTVNGVPGHGGSINGPGPVVVGGAVYVNSGYAFIGQMSGNVLLAFAPE